MRYNGCHENRSGYTASERGMLPTSSELRLWTFSHRLLWEGLMGWVGRLSEALLSPCLLIQAVIRPLLIPWASIQVHLLWQLKVLLLRGLQLMLSLNNQYIVSGTSSTLFFTL